MKILVFELYEIAVAISYSWKTSIFMF